MRFALGLSGGIAAGKTMAAECFRERRIPVIDADVLGKSVLEENRKVQDQVVARFGSICRTQNGELDRRAIGALVFKDPSTLKEFNGIIQPALLDMLRSAMAAKTGLFCVDAALIYEWGAHDLFDAIWVVAAQDEIRLKRLAQNRGLSREEAVQRLNIQMPQAEKCQRAHRVFWNDGTQNELSLALNSALDELMRKLSL